MQTINVPEKITRFSCGADLYYSCEHGQIFHIFREHSGRWPRQGSPLADLVQNLRFQFFPRFAGFARTTDSRGRERYLKGSPGAARARSKPADP